LQVVDLASDIGEYMFSCGEKKKEDVENCWRVGRTRR